MFVMKASQADEVAMDQHLWLLRVLKGIVTLLSGFTSSGLNTSCLSAHKCGDCEVAATGEVCVQVSDTVTGVWGSCMGRQTSLSDSCRCTRYSVASM